MKCDRELSSNSAIPLISTNCFSLFQLVVLFFLPAATLMFWFPLTTLIVVVSNAALGADKLTVHYLPSTKQQMDKLS